MIGLGCKLYVNDGASDAQAIIAKVRSFTLPHGEMGFVDGSYVDQSDAYRKWQPTLVDGKDLVMEVEYNETLHTRMIALYGLSKVWKIEFPDGSYGTVTGTMSMIETQVSSLESIITNNITVRKTSAVVFTSA